MRVRRDLIYLVAYHDASLQYLAATVQRQECADEGTCDYTAFETNGFSLLSKKVQKFRCSRTEPLCSLNESSGGGSCWQQGELGGACPPHVRV
jgi:hypothetical protein